ncbi:MAG: Eco57I restriction-modification methylase domain-containing protein [Brevinema sp.]
MDQETVKKLQELIEHFKQHGTKQDEYNTRSEYIDKLFALLGWDIDNSREKAPTHLKQVLREETVYIDGGAKAPDYSFRIEGKRQFFVEAKKPSVNIHDNPLYALQARSYGYSASEIPLVILTDFQEFSVYDATIRPKENDSAGVARIKYFTCDDYIKPEVFQYLWDTFSYEAVLQGSLKKYLQETKKGGESFDTAFLKSLSQWRLKLADAIFLKNKDLHEIQVNFAVQKIMNRLVFLRFAEDRGTSSYGSLQHIAQKQENRYQALKILFDEARTVYNSDLFGTIPNNADQDEKDRYLANKNLLESLIIDDKTLKEIIDELYFPKSPYAFSVIPIELLGTIYERFLGQKIIRGKYNRAEAVDKIEHRKGQGIYYTPSYIVDYIIQNTLGKQLEGKNPEEIKELTIVDPACGSGSFLIGVYNTLLEWYLQYYTHNSPKKHIKDNRIIERDNGFNLTLEEKQQILLRHVYGVDLDTQAVEVSKLSLMLRLMEGENSAKDSKLTFLPSLEDNIKWGNSLIGTDYTKNIQLELFGMEEQHKIKVFDWDKGFPAIFKRGGFDCVVGNPPWGANIDSLLSYFAKHYPNSTKNHKDSFKLFIEKGINITKPNGCTAMIVPSALLFQPRYKDIRVYIRDNTTINYLWNIGDGVFGANVSAPCCIFITQKILASKNTKTRMLDTTQKKSEIDRIKALQNPHYTIAHQYNFKDTPEESFAIYRELTGNLIPLEEILECKDGGIKHQRIGCGLEEKGKSDLVSRIYYTGKQKNAKDIKYLIGADLSKNGWYIDTSVERFLRGNYKELLREKEIVYFNKELMEASPKIVWRQTSDRIRATIIENFWVANTLQIGSLKTDKYSYFYILSILNSKYFNYLYRQSTQELGRVFPQIKLSKIKPLPIPALDMNDKKQKQHHDNLVVKVEQMLGFHKKLHSAKDLDKPTINTQIKLLDKQIDDIVYQLYNLTDDEIKVIEG